MSRIFNIYFVFKGMNYNAIVSVRSTPFFTEYTLNNFNEELLELLPGDKIVSRAHGHYTFQDACPENSTDLMDAIIKAVSEHMQNVDA